MSQLAVLLVDPFYPACRIPLGHTPRNVDVDDGWVPDTSFQSLASQRLVTERPLRRFRYRATREYMTYSQMLEGWLTMVPPLRKVTEPTLTTLHQG